MTTITIHNVETNEIIEREMTNEEASELEAAQKFMTEKENAEKAARQALLDKLGITADEAKLLLG